MFGEGALWSEMGRVGGRVGGGPSPRDGSSRGRRGRVRPSTLPPSLGLEMDGMRATRGGHSETTGRLSFLRRRKAGEWWSAQQLHARAQPVVGHQHGPHHRPHRRYALWKVVSPGKSKKAASSGQAGSSSQPAIPDALRDAVAAAAARAVEKAAAALRGRGAAETVLTPAQP